MKLFDFITNVEKSIQEINELRKTLRMLQDLNLYDGPIPKEVGVSFLESLTKVGDDFKNSIFICDKCNIVIDESLLEIKAYNELEVITNFGCPYCGNFTLSIIPKDVSQDEGKDKHRRRLPRAQAREFKLGNIVIRTPTKTLQ